MKKLIPLILIIYVAVLFAIQTTWLDLIRVNGVRPDLALILVVFCAMNLDEDRGVSFGFCIGLFQDFLSGGILGVNTLSKGLIAFIFSSLRGKIIVEGWVAVCFFLLVASLFDGLVFYTIASTIFSTGIQPEFLFASLPLYAAFNAIMGPVLFLVFQRNQQWWQQKFVP